ncbi:methyltransferase [Streptomyces sp. NPDC054884]|uniref:methyltransferase n=1 Tax=Streptomyces sp. ME08-AFT2 TaxID=3028683 RepID=UPI0029A27D64|nr:methyltransferase [Streptomyces sp. ME08-AFT2]MDX3312441.1 methyltransferase [Streptomyces sp. ME08-AFT2]
MANQGDPAYERFEFLVNAPALFSAVETAVQLDIFTFLADEGGAGFDRLVEFTGVPAHQLRVLLQAVCATGLLARTDGVYLNSPVAADLLATDAPDSWTHILRGWKAVYYPAFAHLTSAVRAGTNTALADHPGDEPTLYQRLSRNPELEAVFHRAMSAFTLRSLDALVERPEFTTVRHLLDVGGGDGVTSAGLGARYPELRITILDLPSVARIAERESLREFEGRISLHPTDIFAEEFPGGADAVLFSHVLEIFSEDRISFLLQKAWHALPPGGRIFVYGYNVSDDETAGIFSARLGLYFNALASGEGMAYPARDYERWLEKAGFVEVHTVSGLPYEHGLTLGTKAG